MQIKMLVSCAMLVASCSGQAREPLAPNPTSPTKHGIDGYVAHLKANGSRPADYVFGLFRSHDVVILGERLHPEVTQWELIYELVTDPRFVEQVGTIYTEYGAVNLQPRLDRYLADPSADREQLHAIMRDFGNWPTGWNNLSSSSIGCASQHVAAGGSPREARTATGTGAPSTSTTTRRSRARRCSRATS
jgi:hypothetical protein